MTDLAPPADTVADLHATIDELRRQLADRDRILGERISNQAATIEILQTMAASPSDPQPVFDLIVRRAAELCESRSGLGVMRDGQMHLLAAHGFDAATLAAIRQHFPRPPDRSTVSGRAVLDLQTVHVRDVAADTSLSQAVHDLGGNAMVVCPFLRDGEVLGAISLTGQHEGGFSDSQIALLQTFAEQATIAIGSAETYRALQERTRDLQEALEQQTATAEVLRAINASPGNVVPVFEAMLDKAMRLCDAAFGGLATLDGTHMIPAVLRGVPPAYEEYRMRNPVSDSSSTMTGRVLHGASVIHVPDAMAEEVYRHGDPDRRALVDLGGARTSLAVALRKDDALLGMIQLYRQEVRPFSERQIALLENFAAQAVIAMENARLLDDLRQRTSDLEEALAYQTATSDVLKVISKSGAEVEAVLHTLVKTAARLCDAPMAFIHRREGGVYRPAAVLGFSLEFTAYLEGHPLVPGRGSIAGRVALERRPIHILDVTADPEYELSQSIVMAGQRTALGVPLLLGEDEPIGVIVLARQRVQPFTEKEISLVATFADQAVIAIENARLLTELRARTEELARREAELRVTFDNMGDGVAMFDATAHLVAWNHRFQEMFSLPGALLEQRLTYAEHLRYLAERGDYGSQIDSDEQIRRLTADTDQPRAYERTRPDGRVLEIRRNPVPGGGFVLIFSDITERKRSEAEIRAARDAAEAALRDLKAAQANLIQAEKMASLGQLTAGIAHEIKNPLNFVNNFSALSVELLDELKEVAAPGFAALDAKRRADIDELTATLTSNLGKITEHGKRADGIVRSMLEHSRGSSGERRAVDLNALVEDALNLAYHGARAQDQSFNVTLERDFAAGIAPITLTPQDITRVLLNLFSNGFYAVRKRQAADGADYAPTLRVSRRDLGDAVEIGVRDNGIGVPAEIRDKLFQPFFTTKPAGEGTGLGLSLSYDIVVKQHGGQLTVDSRPDAFTEFAISLPRRMTAGEGVTP